MSARTSTARLFFFDHLDPAVRVYTMDVQGDPRVCIQLDGGAPIVLSEEQAAAIEEGLRCYRTRND